MDASSRPDGVELTALLDRQAQLAARVDELDAAEREAAAAVEAASAELVALERSALDGERISPRRRAETEDRLLQAKTTAAAPWAERRAAAIQAVEDARLAVAAFAAEHLDELPPNVVSTSFRLATLGMSSSDTWMTRTSPGGSLTDNECFAFARFRRSSSRSVSGRHTQRRTSRNGG